jgi:hypothetical protein
VRRQRLVGVLGPAEPSETTPQARVVRGGLEQDLAAERDAVAHDPVDAGRRSR